MIWLALREVARGRATEGVPRFATARVVLSGPGMLNAIAFGAKRAFHGFLRVTRKTLASFGLTAARFDMMYVLLCYGGDDPHDQHDTLQSSLRRELGVTAPVISRMVTALERLGWVRRERPKHGDRRQRAVRLTAQGVACIRQAQEVLLRGDRAICYGVKTDFWQRMLDMETLDTLLGDLRSDFGDTAMFFYPWGHPDD